MQEDGTSPCRKTAAEMLAALARLDEQRRTATLELVLELAASDEWWERLETRTKGEPC